MQGNQLTNRRATIFVLSALAWMASGCGDSTTMASTTLASLAVSPSTVTAGNASQLTATLSGGAPAGGAVVTLSSSSTVAVVPASITISAGATSGTTTVTTPPAASTGSATITGAFGGTTRTTTLTVNAAPPGVRADFTVTPDANTGANPGQCAAVSATINGQLQNVLRCTFDGSISMPNPGILAYNWTIPSGATGTAAFTGMILQSGSIMVPCGSFGSAERDVTLTVNAIGGTSSTTKRITFVKPTAC